MKNCKPRFLSRASQCGASSACLCLGPRKVYSRDLSVIWGRMGHSTKILRYFTDTKMLDSMAVELSSPQKLRLSMALRLYALH